MGIAELSVRAVCRLAARRIDLRTEGLENLPAAGPVVLAARHFHHFWDGCALVATVPRPVHIVVALDWIAHPVGRRMMAWACRAVRWPVVYRTDHPGRPARSGAGGPIDGAAAQLRASARDCVALLRADRVLLVFPEGYPNIDPGYTPKLDESSFLPFRPGFLRFVALAQRAGAAPVPIVPVGLDYRRGDRWHLTIRFGSPVLLGPADDRDALLREIEAWVRWHSGERRAAPSDRPSRLPVRDAAETACS